MAIVGVVALNFVNFGNLADPTSILFGTVALIAFLFVVMSFTRTRRGVRIGAYTPPKVLSIVKCGQCSFKQIKNFALGDFVFKALGKCTQCTTGDLTINGIYTEGPPKK